MGHEVLLMPPAYTKPYVKRGKNDAVDADACCEAMSRPGMCFVPIKSAEQQATLMLHKTRELLVKQRTMSVNTLRGHLSEFGIVAAKKIGRVDELLELAASDTTLPAVARAAVKVLSQTLEGLDKAIDDLEDEITSAHAQNEMTRLLYKVPGIGKLIASVIVASVPDPSVFKSGRDFAAWLGLTPRQNSSGGKQTLGAVTKQGNRYIRKLLVLGATSLLNAVDSAKALCATGLSGFWRRSRRGWLRWRWPTSWPELHRVSPSSFLTSEEPRGFSDELIFPSFSLPPRCGLLWPYRPFRRQHDRALAHPRPCPHGARDDAYRPIGRPCARGGLPEGRGARGRGDGHNGRKGRGLPAPPRVGLKPVVADQMTISRRKTIRAVIMRTIIDGTTDMSELPRLDVASQRQV